VTLGGLGAPILIFGFSGPLTFDFAFSSSDLKCIWAKSVNSVDASLVDVSSHLKLASEIKHLTAVLVVILCVAPDEAHLLLKGIPCFEICDAGVLVTAVFAINTLTYFPEADWILDELVVVFQLS